MPIVYSTAYYSLDDVARVKKGETCLIHYAAGGVGQAAIQLANIIGAEIFATVGTEDKKRFVIEKFGVPEDHIFCSRDCSFQQGTMRMTKGRGVDVILNSVSGEGLRHTWDCIAPFGRHIEIGKWDIQTHARLPMNQFSRNVSFCSVDLAFTGRVKVELLGEILENVMKLANAKMITAVQPLHVFPYGRIEEAFRFMQSGKQIGKIALVPHKDDLVMVSIFLRSQSIHTDEHYLYRLFPDGKPL
jgi:NADPH:quinone reductase-like Zn-dependent oxidoreductase